MNLFKIYEEAHANPDFKRSRWATVEEVTIIRDLVEENCIDTYIECGTANGWSSLAALGSFKLNGAYSVDIVARPLIYEVENDDRFNRIIGDFKAVGKGLVSFYLSSKRLIFIDGDHSYKGVKADFEAIKDELLPTDLVLFHDTVGENGVARFVSEIKQAYPNYTIFETRNGMLLLRGPYDAE